MAKTAKHSEVAGELKKEYLRAHLESVKALVRSWTSELHAPEPFAPVARIWGWQMCYRSPRLDNPDDNHILRRHLNGRALWSHHGNLERKLEEIWRLTQQVRLEAQTSKESLSVNSPWRYTDAYVPVALWKAFDMALGREIGLRFTVPDGQLGLSFGAYRIEESATTPEARASVEKEYEGFIHALREFSQMKELGDAWQVSGQLETQISALADKALKSGDIFYTCRFCRHLWQ
jgi:hypothetical protein